MIRFLWNEKFRDLICIEIMFCRVIFFINVFLNKIIKENCCEASYGLKLKVFHSFNTTSLIYEIVSFFKYLSLSPVFNLLYDSSLAVCNFEIIRSFFEIIEFFSLWKFSVDIFSLNENLTKVYIIIISWVITKFI